MRVLLWISIGLVLYGLAAALVFRGIPALGHAIHRHGPAAVAYLRTIRSDR
ncbi:hypothetical protein ABZ070_19370 [Streptomyces sp. NPDC006283]|uniref:hypothetical protein n=1 Tax=Streptomyces sp. NPDC006283 TaxID=3156741 RepID=UPI0033B48715